jgi:hypothetical protein
MIDKLVNIIVNNLKKSKHKFMSVEDVRAILKAGLGDKYTTQINVAVKDALIEDKRIDFFREDTYIHDNKFYYSTGNWFAIKGVYSNPIEMKFKKGWYSWQTSDKIDWDDI